MEDGSIWQSPGGTVTIEISEGRLILIANDQIVHASYGNDEFVLDIDFQKREDIDDSPDRPT